jgi:hypothetical protein
VTGWRRYWDYSDRNFGETGFDRFDLIQWALEKETSGPATFTPQGVGGEAFSSFSYENGPKVLIGHPVERDQDIEFVGSQGSLSSSSRGQLNSEPKDLTRTKFGAGDLRLPVNDTPETSWINSMKTRVNPVVDARAGHRSATVCHLNVIAQRLGRAIKWDPQKEEIIGDPIASRMLDRPRRAPYTLV